MQTFARIKKFNGKIKQKCDKNNISTFRVEPRCGNRVANQFATVRNSFIRDMHSLNDLSRILHSENNTLIMSTNKIILWINERLSAAQPRSENSDTKDGRVRDTLATFNMCKHNETGQLLNYYCSCRQSCREVGTAYIMHSFGSVSCPFSSCK